MTTILFHRVMVLLVFSFFGALAYAQPAVYEVEPNNTPAEANKISGAVTIMGSMEKGDQDGFLWFVSDNDARKRWTLALTGIPGKLTIVDIFRIEWADNGVDVASKELLFKMGTRDGSKPSIHENLLFEPGDYIIGIASAGGGGVYRPPTTSLSFGVEEKKPAIAAEDSEPGGYRLSIREGKRLLLEMRPKKPSSKNPAFNLRLGYETAAYIETPNTRYQFEVTDKDTGKRWDIDGQVPVGRQVNAVLRTSDSSQLARVVADEKGKFSFRDLGLQTGSYTIEITGKEAGYIRALAASSAGLLIKGAEAEPNDQWKLANRADLSQPVTGRMGKTSENDYFRFSLDEATADQVLALRLESAASQPFEFCLLDRKGARIQCRTGKGLIELPDLVLEPGDWGLVVGRGALNAKYSVTMSTQGAIRAGVEAEPNDKIEFAAGVPANNRIKGRFSGTDTDFYRILVTSEPQLWRIQVIGDEIHEFAYHDGAGIQNQTVRAAPGQRRVRLDNLFLLPGTHYIRVSGRDGGSYTLLARAIGPPDANGEFEPNDDTSRMQPLRIGQTRTGLLEDKADRDNYRFHLANWDRIRLTIEPPSDGEVLANLFWDTKPFKNFNKPQSGQKIELEGLFPPGDYRLQLNAQKTSEAEYKLSLQRLERFSCPTDCEPNDNIDFANPLPASLIVQGRVNEWRDADWYRLPVFDQPTEITAASEPKREVAVVEYARTRSLVKWDNNARVWRGTIPAGIQTYFEVKAWGDSPYRLKLNFAGGPPVKAEPALLPLKLSLDLETTEVGAYRQYGQQVAGQLQLVNTGAASAAVELEAVTSDYRWQVELEQSTVTIPPGRQLTVPLTLRVPTDAWADWPVRISVRATSTEGAQAEGFAEVSAGRETPPVNAIYGWTLPEQLRGGFNVAWKAVGGRWTGKKNGAIGSGFAELFDGMAVENKGLQLRGGTKPENINVTVELAGDLPVEVAGFTLNPLAGTFADRFLRNVDISLSLDGSKFTPVAEDVLLPIKAEQAFVLDQPVPARFARLRLRSAFDGQAQPSLGLGEFKVIAKPGIDISAGKGFNLASPALGGHVVWSRPQLSVANWDEEMLLEDGKFYQQRVKAGQSLEWVVGFHHDRAAQISSLEWVDSTGIKADRKVEKVTVAVSEDSPVGPWQPVGDWDLSSTGSPSVFTLDTPVWARFVKFTVAAPEQMKTHALPEVLRIRERPGKGKYRSILTEWGFSSQAAIYEALHPLQVEKPLKPSGNDSKATAATLEFNQLATGQVILGKYQNWYKLRVPADENTLTITIGGDPTVRTVVTLQNKAGNSIPVRKVASKSTPQRHILEAIVEPGGSYYLKIEEPPRNVVFLWDTSASVGAYLPVIYNSLIAYAEDLVPGRDAANLIPFGRGLLLRDWYGEPYILQTVLNDYPRKESSSEAEKTLHTATRALAPRAGTKAIIMVTDAATDRYAAAWDEFEQVQPRIFGLGVGSQGAFSRNPAREQDLMQDWSRVNGGHYAYLLSEGDLEIAFDRAATMLRRPAGYTLKVASSFRKAPGPGSLQVVAKGGGTSSGSAGSAVELILDASGSMLKRLDGKRRIVIAKEVLNEAVNKYIPAGTPVALRVFGHKEPNSCRTDLEIVLKPLDPAAASKTIQGINAMNLARTPIADSLARVESDLGKAQGHKVVVLVTDGEETCDGDPEKVIQKLRDKGFQISLNIVGFAINNAELESKFERWAELGGGRYFSARNQQGLSESLREALRTPYSVYDQSGSLVGKSVVGGELLKLEAGFYRVVVASSPPRTFERVEIAGEEKVILEAIVGGR
ncbi:MAG: hypothetical protein BMS9Abin08_1242 [Gammaproteobacteria bacterium]|nr:MAG: hypothetical protein BMS9Abin08_1242 [Gammaproteobacteria bacterium]